MSWEPVGHGGERKDGSSGLQPVVAGELAEILELARQAVEATGAGITVLEPAGGWVSIAASTPGVRAAEQLQVEFGQGPGPSVGQSLTVVSGDIGAEPRWPRWGPAVAALGWCSLLATQIQVDGKGVGALTVYSARPRSFTTDEVALTHLFARQAATTLSRARP